jgi:hypothetical protein
MSRQQLPNLPVLLLLLLLALLPSRECAPHLCSAVLQMQLLLLMAFVLHRLLLVPLLLPASAC